MLTRRDFVKSAAVLAAAASAHARQPSAAQPPVQAPATPKRQLRKAVMIGMVSEGKSLLDRFKVLRDTGFHGAELDSPGDLKADEVRAAAEATGIVPHGVVNSKHWSIPMNAPDPEARKLAVQHLKTAIRDARDWGASSVLFVPCVVNKDLPYDQAWQLSTEGIRECIPFAEECKVKIAIENVWNNFLLSPMEAAEYVDQFKSPWVVFHLDLGNLEPYGWGEQWVRILGKRTWKLHIKEYSRKKLDEEGRWKGFVDLLDGTNNWPAVMKALDDVGYSTGESRWATAEIGGGDAKRMKAIAEKMDKIFAM